MIFSPSRHVGVAVGPRSVTVVTLARTLPAMAPGTAVRRPLSGGIEGADWPALAEVLSGVREELGVEEATAHVALLGGLARTKVLDLPPAGRDELRRLLEGSAGRYFPRTPGRSVVADTLPGAAAARTPGGSSASNAEAPDAPEPAAACPAVCADRVAVEAVISALRRAGFRPGAVTAGGWALTRGVLSLSNRSGHGSVAVEARSGDWNERIVLRDGRPLRFEPLRPEDPAGAERPPPGTDGGSVTVRRDPDAPGGAELMEPSTLDAGGVAAWGALVMREDGPLLLPPELRRRWRRRIRWRAGGLVGVAVALLALGAGLHLWGIAREAEAVGARRDAMSAEVAEATRARNALDDLAEVLESFAALEAGRVSRTRILALLAEELPPGTYLRSLRVDGPSVELTGISPSAPSLVPALEEVTGVTEAVLLSTRRAPGTDGEEFEIVMTMEPDPAPGGGAVAPGGTP